MHIFIDRRFCLDNCHPFERLEAKWRVAWQRARPEVYDQDCALTHDIPVRGGNGQKKLVPLKIFYKALSKMCMICAMQVNLERALLFQKKNTSLSKTNHLLGRASLCLFNHPFTYLVPDPHRHIVRELSISKSLLCVVVLSCLGCPSLLFLHFCAVISGNSAMTLICCQWSNA